MVLELILSLALLGQGSGCDHVRLHASDAAVGARFGAALASEGDLLLVGSPGKREVAYLFEHDGQAWHERQRLVADGTLYDNDLGRSVDLSRGRAILGGPHYDDPLQGDECDGGVVMIYEPNDAGWQRSFRLYGECDDLLGSAVAIEGDWAAAGAPAQQYVQLLHRRNGAWELAQRLVPPTGSALGFGAALALEAGRLVVGAPEDRGTRGSVFVFTREGASWRCTGRLVPDDLEPGARFGSAVALYGERLCVGAPSWSDPSRTSEEQGQVRVYRGSGSLWRHETNLCAVGAPVGARFGAALDADRGGCVAGAPGAAMAYVYEVDQGSWGCARTFAADPPSQAFATSIAARDEDTILVGDPDNGELASQAGCVWIDEGGPRAVAYCTCAAGAPCSNEWAFGGCANSTGQGARLYGCGSSSTRADDLLLLAEPVAPARAGVLFMSRLARPAAPPFGDGQLCIGSSDTPLFRFPLVLADGAGVLRAGPGLVARSRSQLPPDAWIAPGDSWHFQWYYQDAGGPCGARFNSTNALAVEFLP